MNDTLKQEIKNLIKEELKKNMEIRISGTTSSLYVVITYDGLTIDYSEAYIRG